MSPPPASDSDGAGEVDYPHGGGRTRGRPVAELPLAVPSPAPHSAVPKEHTGVIGPGGDRGGTGDSAHGHRHRGTGRPRGWVSGGPVAELALDVLPPAPHCAVSQERTGVSISAGDRDGTGESAHRDRRGGEGSEGPVTALPGLAQPPAPRRAVPEERARELVASCNARRSGEAVDCHQNGGVVEGPVAELPELVPPYALSRPIGKEHTGVLPAG